MAGSDRGGRGLTLFSLGKSRALWFCQALPRTSSLGDYSVSSLSVSSWKYLRAAPIGLLCQGVQGICRPVFIYTGYPRCYPHSCKTHHPSLSMVINCDVANKDQNLSHLHFNTLFIILLWSLFLCFLPVICTICPVV